MGTHWDHPGTTLGPPWGYPWTTLGYTLGIGPICFKSGDTRWTMDKKRLHGLRQAVAAGGKNTILLGLANRFR